MIAVTIHLRRCGQCYGWRTYPAAFLGKRGKPVNFCTSCQARYSGWADKTPEQRASAGRKGVPALSTLRAHLVVDSRNEKLGGIPSSWTSRGTCPTTCSFYDAGCYALYGKLGHHWRTVGTDGDTWEKFCADVSRLPFGQLWRLNVAGDLPGDGRGVDFAALKRLVEANVGRRGFGFTHHRNATYAVRYANEHGLTINLSADSLEEADRLAARGQAPVTVVVPHDAPLSLRTPAGRRVTICPAETEAKLTCAECELCAMPNRKVVIGFRSHGQSFRQVDRLVQIRRTA